MMGSPVGDCQWEVGSNIRTLHTRDLAATSRLLPVVHRWLIEAAARGCPRGSGTSQGAVRPREGRCVRELELSRISARARAGWISQRIQQIIPLLGCVRCT